MLKFDINKSESLDQCEFIVAFMDREILCTDANLITIYKGINKNNKSGLSKDDLIRALQALAPDNDTTME